MNKNHLTVLKILLAKDPGYITYPAELEKLSRKIITRAGAKIVCDKLTNKGILQIEKKRSSTWSKTTSHYSIGQDIESLRNLVREYFQYLVKNDPFSWQKEATWFNNSHFIRSLVNSNLVRDTLSSKNVVISKIKNLKNKKSKEELEKFKEMVSISFPIKPANYKTSQMFSIAKSHQDTTSTIQQKKIEKIIKEHYDNIEENEIILPILALIRISPTALEYFLSDWKPYIIEGTTHYTSTGISAIEHVLFRLIWDAINDLSIIRDIPQNELVHSALVSGGGISSSKTSSLLEITLMDLSKIEYNAGFDTQRDYYGDGENIVEIEINPENCRVNIIFKDRSHALNAIKSIMTKHKLSDKKSPDSS